MPEGVQIIWVRRRYLDHCGKIKRADSGWNDTSIQRGQTWPWGKTTVLHRWQYLPKAAAVVGTKRIYYRMPRLIIDGSEIQWKNQLTYLGVELDRQLWFGTHIHKVALKAFGTAGYLSRLMQSLGVPKALIRRLNKQTSLQSQILYIAPVWTKALEERLTRETWNELICLPHQESILDDRRREQALLDLKRQARDRLHKKLQHKWDQDTAGRWA